MAGDIQSVTGKNMSLIGEITNINPLKTSYGKQKAAFKDDKLSPFLPQDRWCLPYLYPLISEMREDLSAHWSSYSSLLPGEP